jgi:hypothetical protein
MTVRLTGSAGPALPDLRDVRAAETAAEEADLAGCTEAEHDRLILARQQTRAAFRLAGDREPEPEASDLGRFEPTPYDLGITGDPDLGWADVQPGAREFCAQDADIWPERERLKAEADAARMDELERQAAELGLDVFGDPLPGRPVPYTLTPQAEAELAAPEPEPEAEL